MKTIFTLLAVCLLAGCGTTGNKIVPSNRFKDNEREITLAQNNHAKNIIIRKTSVDKRGNTNSVLIKIDGLQAENDPNVIDASGKANAASIAGYAQLFAAGAQFGQEMLGKALQAYAMSHGVPILSASKSQPAESVLGKAVKVDGKVYTLRRKPDIYIGEDGELYRLQGDTMNPL